MDMAALLDRFFAIAPWVLFAAIVLTVYIASRGSRSGRAGVPIAQTFACNRCGHRGKREHMIPISREGSIMWYCPRCAAQV